MPEFITLFCVPNATLGTLAFPPTFPLDINSSYGIQAGVPTGALGFGASIESMIHRNWKPYSWDLTGNAQSGFSTNGTIPFPGPVGSETINFETIESGMDAEWEGLPFHPTKAQPDFSRSENVRQMISWGGGGGGFYPDPQIIYHDSIFPVFWDENGDNQTGWYVESTFRPYAIIGPYYWETDGSYYCQHEIRIDITTQCVPSPGLDPIPGWNPIEGGSFVDYGGSSNSINSGTVVGVAGIQDSTGVDPVSDWGSVQLRSPSMDSPSFPASLTLHVRRNFLPIPGYD